MPMPMVVMVTREEKIEVRDARAARSSAIMSHDVSAPLGRCDDAERRRLLAAVEDCRGRCQGRYMLRLRYRTKMQVPQWGKGAS